MPLEPSDFPEEVQVAFFIFSFLSDNWDGMSGTYLGKNWTQCNQLFELYDVENKKETLFFMKLYENILVSHIAEQAEQKRKAEERRAKSGGKSYAHNIKG